MLYVRFEDAIIVSFSGEHVTSNGLKGYFVIFEKQAAWDSCAKARLPLVQSGTIMSCHLANFKWGRKRNCAKTVSYNVRYVKINK